MNFPRRLALAALAGALFAGCASGPRPRALPYRIVEPVLDRTLTLDELAERLARHDVVFLGELHDSPVAHRLQFETTRRLADRRGALLLSLEMFERDVQPELDRYLRGEKSEGAFLRESRPWRDYAVFYRPAVEWARRTGRAVLAANFPRSLARTVASEGLSSVSGAPELPRAVDTSAGEYRERFLAVVGSHGALSAAEAERWFAAQCLKDDAMAESLADALERYAAAVPLAVHWCGRFHSDFGLGTVERLRARRPDLSVAVVSTVRREDVGAPLEGEDVRRADFVWIVAE